MRTSVLFVAVTFALLGCGKEAVVKAKLYPVKGRVTVNGQPISGCMITFVPLKDKVDKGAADGYAGKLNDKGEFELASPTNEKGAAAGFHKVVFSMPPVDNSPEKAMERMKTGLPPEEAKEPPYPAQYGAIATTKEVEVKREANDLKIEL